MDGSVKIIVNGGPTGLEDFARAKRATQDELPDLSHAQREVVRKFRISEEEYKHAVLAQQYGSQRMMERAEKFVSKLSQTLKKNHIKGQIVKLERCPGELIWLADIAMKAGAGSVRISMELFDDVVDDTNNDPAYTKYLDAKLNSVVQRSLDLGDVA